MGPGNGRFCGSHFDRGADAILADNRAFANLLGREGIAVLLPAAAIVLLAQRGKVGVKEAIEALGKIEGLVRRPVYEAAMEELDGMLGNEEESR